MATDSFADAVASCRYLRNNNVRWTTGRKRMIGIMAAIRTAMHNADSRQPIRNPNRSPRIDRLMDASIRWAEPIMSKIDLPYMAARAQARKLDIIFVEIWTSTPPLE